MLMIVVQGFWKVRSTSWKLNPTYLCGEYRLDEDIYKSFIDLCACSKQISKGEIRGAMRYRNYAKEKIIEFSLNGDAFCGFYITMKKQKKASSKMLSTGKSSTQSL